MSIDECYAELDLRPGAPQEDVKRAHKLLATVWHPDRFEGDGRLRTEAELKLKRINSAYVRLMDYFARGGAGAEPTAE
jgi:curved DNA-binding protein CbpA